MDERSAISYLRTVWFAKKRLGNQPKGGKFRFRVVRTE